MKKFVVVAYDVSDDKRRLKIAKILEGCGVRKNFSVFECMLSESEVKSMQKKVNKLADSKSDCILYYYLCKACVEKREVVGRQPVAKPEVVLI